MKSSLLPRGIRWLFGLTVAVLAVTGFGQMPIFKRYYLADLPGMGWLAQYYVTHTIHYAAAAVLLALLSYLAVAYLRAWRPALRITGWGLLRILIIGILVASGVARVLKNRPDVFLAPEAVFAIDLAHLGAAILWGIVALAARLAGRPAYLGLRRPARRGLTARMEPR
jgi:hypothetical protein